jgi:hypothetical protein|tara:strand:+ start:941 stop:1702 length:762 start_codon:yes stop_codon:yes gene_type:complete
MEPLFSTWDISVGIVAGIVAVLAVYLFLRASNGGQSVLRRERSQTHPKREYASTSLREPRLGSRGYRTPTPKRSLKRGDINSAQSKIRTLTLQSELLSLTLKRLFEAEDDGEITADERADLSKGYEGDLKKVNEELEQAELVVSLHELELIREDIVKKFEATLNSTQSRIDSIMEELKITGRAEKAKTRIQRTSVEREKEEREPDGENEAGEAGDENQPKHRSPRSDVDARLEKLRGEVIKELEELDRLELEV